MMKIKLGVAGSMPSKDSFPMFGGAKRWTCLHWDAETVPSSWCIAWYEQPPDWFNTALEEVASAKGGGTEGTEGTPPGPTLVQSSLFPLPPTRLALKVVRLCDISDLYMETAPSTAFRIYCGKEVIMMTPIRAYNLLSRRSASWADALYSMMALQAESDAELVLLYKQEFVDLLQHALEQQQQQHKQPMPAQSDSGADGTGVEGNRRPAMMRRRSSLSSLLGIAASKPLQVDPDEAEALSAEQENAEISPQSKKMTFKGAVKMVQGALKRSGLLSEGRTEETNRNSFRRTYLLDRKTSVIKERRAPMYGTAEASEEVEGAEDNGAQTLESQEDSAGQGSRVPFQRSASSSAALPSPNYLSQSLLSSSAAISPVNKGRSGLSGGGASSAPESNQGDANKVQDLQDQINALLEQNRALQQMLHPAYTSTDANHPSSGSGADAPTTSSHVPAPPAVKYSTEELSTLRNFTARSNFHQNQHTLKNSKRAFSHAGLGLDGTSGMDRAAFLAARRAKQDALNAAPVLGRQTVLDILLAQTGAAPVDIDAGDDYYNDTIELEPQQIEQLIELHKLQQLHLRGEARRSGMSQEGDGATPSEEGKESETDGAVPVPPPAPVRRRRDSTTSIHFRQEGAGGGDGSPGSRPVPSLFVAPAASRGLRADSNASAHSSGGPISDHGSSPVPADRTEQIATEAIHAPQESPSSAMQAKSLETSFPPPSPAPVHASPSRPPLVKAASLGAGVHQALHRSAPPTVLPRQVSAQHVLEYITSDHESSLTAGARPGAKGMAFTTTPPAQRVPLQKQTSKGTLKKPTINERQMLHAAEREMKLLSLLSGDEGAGGHPPGAERMYPEQRPRADSKLTSSARSTSTDEDQYMRTDAATRRDDAPASAVRQASATHSATDGLGARGGAEVKTSIIRGKVSRMGSGVLQATGVSTGAAAVLSPKSPPRLAARLASQQRTPAQASHTAALADGASGRPVDPLSDADEGDPGNAYVHLAPPQWHHDNFYPPDKSSDNARRASRKTSKRAQRAGESPLVSRANVQDAAGGGAHMLRWMETLPQLHVLSVTLLSGTSAADVRGMGAVNVALVLLPGGEASDVTTLLTSAKQAYLASSTNEIAVFSTQDAEQWQRRFQLERGRVTTAVRWLAVCVCGEEEGGDEVLLVSLSGTSLVVWFMDCA
jgi:hypothetical protein